MPQYIDKAAVVAEIESLRCTSFTNFDEGVNATVQTLLEILDTFEVKEVDLNDAVERYVEQHKSELHGYMDIRRIARHFFELGLKAQKGE